METFSKNFVKAFFRKTTFSYFSQELNFSQTFYYVYLVELDEFDKVVKYEKILSKSQGGLQKNYFSQARKIFFSCSTFWEKSNGGTLNKFWKTVLQIHFYEIFFLVVMSTRSPFDDVTRRKKMNIIFTGKIMLCSSFFVFLGACPVFQAELNEKKFAAIWATFHCFLTLFFYFGPVFDFSDFRVKVIFQWGVGGKISFPKYFRYVIQLVSLSWVEFHYAEKNLTGSSRDNLFCIFKKKVIIV